MHASNTMNRGYAVLAAGLGLAGLALVTRAGTLAPGSGWARTDALAWLVFLTLAAMSPVPLPRRARFLRLTPVFDLAAVFVFGPVWACWFAAASRIVAFTFAGWCPTSALLVRFGRAVAGVAAAGTVYAGLGGETGRGLLSGTSQVLPLAAAVVAYLAVRTAAVVPVVPGSGYGRGLGRRLADALAGAGLEAALVPVGILLAITHSQIGVLSAALFAVPLVFARHAMRLWREDRLAHVETVRTLMQAVDAGDAFTRGHSSRIAAMAVQIARHMGCPPEEVQEIEYAALLHDVGRTAIQRDILDKPGRLSATERAELRAHPRIARDLMRRERFFGHAAEIVYAHHEQPDGGGYPRGLTGTEIPLGSRIISAVAAFDAMISDRPYRRGLAHEAAIEELLSHAGTQFFPDVVETLVSLFAAGELRHGKPETRVEYAVGGDSEGPSDGDIDALEGAAIIEFPEELRVSLGRSVENRSLAWGEDLRLDVAALSDVGCVRDMNEDYYGVFEGDVDTRGHLLVLADGMGGAAAGEVASMLAVETVSSSYYGPDDAGPVGEMLERALRSANQAIHGTASDDSAMTGMGTTCTAAVFQSGRLHLAHVGDSRAYLIDRHGIRRLTQDHTLAVELERLAPDSGMATSTARNVLTRCLGNDVDVEVDLLDEPLALMPGQFVLLCSDGLSSLVEDEEILARCRTGAPGEVCRTLADLARARGGPDNITVVMAEVRTNHGA